MLDFYYKIIDLCHYCKIKIYFVQNWKFIFYYK